MCTGDTEEVVMDNVAGSEPPRERGAVLELGPKRAAGVHLPHKQYTPQVKEQDTLHCKKIVWVFYVVQ